MNHSIESYDVEVPTPLDILVGMVSKTANEENIGWLQSFSVRCPMAEACLLDALAAHSGQSRNKIVVQIIKTGLDALWTNLPPAEREQINAIQAKLLGERLEARSGESGEV